jgi:hypothetical protein
MPLGCCATSAAVATRSRIMPRTAASHMSHCHRNKFGQLGLGHANDEVTPRVVEALAGHPVTLLSCGWRHTMAVTGAGEVYAWGRGVNGERGGGVGGGWGQGDMGGGERHSSCGSARDRTGNTEGRLGQQAGACGKHSAARIVWPTHAATPPKCSFQHAMPVPLWPSHAFLVATPVSTLCTAVCTRTHSPGGKYCATPLYCCLYCCCPQVSWAWVLRLMRVCPHA